MRAVLGLLRVMERVEPEREKAVILGTLAALVT